MTGFDKDQMHVLVPTTYGLTVCPLGQLLYRDDDSLDELVSNSGIDTTNFTNDPDEVMALIERVRRLNETGDARAYWALES